MTPTPSYRAWYPVLTKRGTDASVILTPGSSSSAPAGGRSFFENLMEMVAVSGQLVAWGTHPFMSPYFSDGAWQESWDAKLILEDGVRQRPDEVLAGVGIFVEPDGEDVPSRYLPVRVIADFTRARDAERCRTALKERAAQAKWNEIHYEGYTVRDVGPQLKQLVVTVSTGERSELQPLIDAAADVLTICEDHGGRTRAPRA